MKQRVCISGCCWCGIRCEHVEFRIPADLDLSFAARRPVVPWQIDHIARPCGHPVSGELVKRADGRLVATMFPPGEQAPCMRPLPLATCDDCGQVRPCVTWRTMVLFGPDTGEMREEEARCTACRPPVSPEAFMAGVRSAP